MPTAIPVAGPATRRTKIREKKPEASKKALLERMATEKSGERMAAEASGASPSATPPPTSENPSSATEAGQPAGMPGQINMGIGTTTHDDKHIPLYARWYQNKTIIWNVYNALSFEPRPIDEPLFNKSEEAILDDYGGRNIQQGITSPGFLFKWLSPVTQYAIHDQYGIFFLTMKTKTFELWDATDYTISFPPTIGELPFIKSSALIIHWVIHFTIFRFLTHRPPN
jgi:hypothetical protein